MSTGDFSGMARVLRLVTRLNIGGPARQALLLSRELDAEFPTTLAAGHPEPDEGELSDPAVAVTYLPLVRPVRPTSDIASLIEVRRLLGRLRPAIVHTHMAKAGTVGRAAAMSQRHRPRTIHTFHGHVLDGYFSKPATRMIVETERFLAKHTDALVAVSPQVRDQLLGLGIGKPETFRVIPLGFDLSRFLDPSAHRRGDFRASIGVRSDVPLVGMIGRLVAIKDVPTALAALARLDGVHLAVVGDGELRSSLERRAGEMRITDRVHFTGWRKDVAAVMEDVDVVLLTSRNEGTPVSLIEAAAARPVVATDVGGVRFVVDDGETGIVVPPEDPSAIAAALSSLVADSHRRAQLGEAARPRACARFGMERLVTDIASLYREVLDRR